MTPESRVKTKVKKYLTNYYQFWPVPTGYGKQMVDCLAWGYGKAMAIECKREGIEKLTPRQAAIMREMRKFRIETWLVTMRDGELVWLKQTD